MFILTTPFAPSVMSWSMRLLFELSLPIPGLVSIRYL